MSKIRDNLAKNLPGDVLATAQAATTQWKPGSDLISPFPANGAPRPARVRGQGSGFVIGKGGEIATDYHVVPNCREIRVKDSAGRFNVVTRVIASDKTADLALLAGGGVRLAPEAARQGALAGRKRRDLRLPARADAEQRRQPDQRLGVERQRHGGQRQVLPDQRAGSARQQRRAGCRSGRRGDRHRGDEAQTRWPSRPPPAISRRTSTSPPTRDCCGR